MSKMRSDRKPPLAKSPLRLRPPRVVRSSSTSLSTPAPPGSVKKSQKLNSSLGLKEQEIRSEYRTISTELQDLTNMLRVESGKGEEFENGGIVYLPSPATSSIFERGKFYDEYSARRNERLKRKKGETPMEQKIPHTLGVNVESVKRNSSRKHESLRKSVSAAYSMETPRYMLRSMSKENKKPPLPPLNWDKALPGEESKLTTRRARRI